MDISYAWRTLGGAQPSRYFFADVLPATLTRDYPIAAIYRRALSAPAVPSPCEVYHYLKPGLAQLTSIRLSSHFLAQAEEGVKTELQLLHFEPFQLNTVLISESNLLKASIRKMLEQFLIADHDVVNCALLNLKSNPIERRLRTTLKTNAEAN